MIGIRAERNGRIMAKNARITKRTAAVLLSAVSGLLLLTSCGRKDSESSADHAAEQSVSQTDTTVISETDLSTTSKRSLAEKAESALDSLREDITSILREGTKEVHPFD